MDKDRKDSALEVWAEAKLKARKRKLIAVVVAAAAALAAVAAFSLSRSAALRNEKDEMAAQIDSLKKLVDNYRPSSSGPEEPEEASFIFEPDPVIVDTTIKEGLTSIQELVTSEYNYTNAASFANEKMMTLIKWDVAIPFTSKSLVILYDGRIKAGMDLGRAAININEEKRTITVALPACKITSHEVFEDSIKIVEEEQSWFNEITTDDYLKLITSQTVPMEQKAIDRGLLKDADSHARVIVESFLKQIPGMDTYTLTVQ